MKTRRSGILDQAAEKFLDKLLGVACQATDVRFVAAIGVPCLILQKARLLCSPSDWQGAAPSEPCRSDGDLAAHAGLSSHCDVRSFDWRRVRLGVEPWRGAPGSCEQSTGWL